MAREQLLAPARSFSAKQAPEPVIDVVAVPGRRQVCHLGTGAGKGNHSSGMTQFGPGEYVTVPHGTSLIGIIAWIQWN